MLSKKNKNDNSSIKSIVTLNVYRDKKYIFQNDIFKQEKKIAYNKSNFIASYINNKDVISTTITVSKNIPDSDLADIIDIRAYEELGLDQASDYIISSVESESDSEERIFHVFVANPDVLDKLFLSVKNDLKYIDLITPAPLLYKALYKREILKGDGVHCFMYFTQEDSFITFYRNGEYLYSKSIDYSLHQIYDKYCEMVGEKVDPKEFYSTLELEGLKTFKAEYQQNFMKIFSDVFISINDIIIYAKRAFEFETIDHLFIGAENGPIVGLDEYSQNYLGLQATDFNFNYNIENNEWYIDQLQFLMLLTSLDYIDNKNALNLTKYPRPPAFINRASGQFIIATTASIAIGLAYPLYFLVGSYVNDAKISLLEVKDKKLTNEANRYRKILEDKINQITMLDKDIDKHLKIYNDKSKTLIAIYNKKVNYKLKSEILHEFAKELDLFNVRVKNISSNNNIFELLLSAKNDRDITEFIKYISDTHYDTIKNIEIKEIYKGNGTTYNGLLKVELK